MDFHAPPQGSLAAPCSTADHVHTLGRKFWIIGQHLRGQYLAGVEKVQGAPFGYLLTMSEIFALGIDSLSLIVPSPEAAA